MTIIAPATAPNPQPVVESSPRFDVWAYIGGKGSTDGWSRMASAATFEQAMIYKRTCLHKISFQPHKESR